ncbi:helix-turn-helix domain-containing protein [Alteromonas australica]|uniref:helix-turn-helix domain-containing protein n=1 Tax=Alteromonas australica TaxID=589873 RepID=UPI0035C804E0
MIKHINDPRYEALIKWLSNARKEQGLTLEQLGAAMDESHQFVNKVESCQRRLNVFEYYQYCEALKLDPREGFRFFES